MSTNTSKQHGFTIVELLVVIVVIGILAAITIVSYTGITSKATVAVLQSDLTSASNQLRIYQANYGSFPLVLDAGMCPSKPVVDNKTCLKASNGNTFSSYSSTGSTFTLVETSVDGVTKYQITDNTSPAKFALDPNLIAGIASTVLAGKYVRSADTGAPVQYKIANTAVESPQGVIGSDPDFSDSMVLVSPQANSGVDFSAYPAQNACKSVGARLPNMQELLAIYAGRVTYGNNFQYTNGYWSATEYTSAIAHLVGFDDGGVYVTNKTVNYCVRCIVD